MKISFNGARRELAYCFNELVKTNLDAEQKEKMQNLQCSVGTFLAMYDPENKDGDCIDLSDKVKLLDVNSESDNDCL
jgi:hypothetical protein